MTPSKSLPLAIGFMVALVEAGVPKFSKEPMRHLTKAAATEEANRLAAKYPGSVFQVFQPTLVKKADVVLPQGPRDYEPAAAYKAPPPRIFSDLSLQKDAPAGVYKLAVATRDSRARFVVLVNGPYRSVLFAAPGEVAPMNLDSWRAAHFVATGESVMEVLAR